MRALPSEIDAATPRIAPSQSDRACAGAYCAAMTSTRHAPLDFWRAAEYILNVIFNLFGEPQDIAQNPWVAPKTHKLIARWLRGAEALLRRLLLLEAAALNLAPTPRRARAPRQRTRRLHAFYPDDPSTWRVSFRCSERGASSARTSPRRFGAAATQVDAFVLALRYEALLRVYNDPAPYARRLALRGAVTRAMLAPCPDAANLIGDDYAAIDLAAHSACANAATRDDSS